MKYRTINEICSKTPISLCFLINYFSSSSTNNIGLHDITICQCYARSVDLENTTIFQVASSLVYILTLITLIIILFSVNKKYTAVGRLEYIWVFQLMILHNVCNLIVDCGVVPPHSYLYQYFVCLQIGFVGAICYTLIVNVLLQFKLWEDGTKISKIILYLTSLFGFSINFIISFISLNNWFSNTTENQTVKNGTYIPQETNFIGMIIIVYGLNGALLFLFSILQSIVSIFIVKNYWIFGTTVLCVGFFIIGQVCLYGFSYKICLNTNHYLDGVFAQNVCNLFSIMMFYKSWDIASKEDLEYGINIYMDK